MGYRSVVVGTDGSETAQDAVRQAADVAKAFGARLTVVTAYQPHSTEEVTRSQDEVPEDLKYLLTDVNQAEDLAGRGRELAKQLGLSDVRVRTASGDPAEALLGVADDVSADLIVVGSKGMTKASRFLLGSVPNRVSHHAPCDVFIVHTAP